ncbi:MAG: fumarylacetoacetate hydrolase family protein, partial [Dehalococcoidia bacterium]
MQVVRFRYGQRGAISGIVENDHVRPVEGDIFGQYQRLAAAIPLARVRLLAPVTPTKVLAMALNYRSHGGERTPPSQPELFLKTLSAVVGPDEPIVIPKGTERVDFEGELVVVMGRRAKGVPPEEALEYVFGYTCGNDVSARDWQRSDMQWWRAKGADTFAPLGPWMITSLDPSNLELHTRVNGEEKQNTTTNLLIHD